MFKIFEYLKSALPQIFLIIILLIIQAWGDLSLPQYTSDIVDIGIQQGGIESAAAQVLTEDGYETLYSFLSDDDRQLISSSYTLTSPKDVPDSIKQRFPLSADESVYILNKGENSDYDAVSDALAAPMMLCRTLESMSFDEFVKAVGGSGAASDMLDKASSFDDIAAMLGVSSDKPATALTIVKLILSSNLDAPVNSTMISKFSDMPDSILSQSAIEFVKTEYISLGADLEAMQIDYLLGKGAAMAAIAFIMMIVSIITGFIAARVAARTGMQLRAKVFRNVVGFSNAEIDKFSTASLITRSTNDIQQIQMVIVMLLRMVMYAPILGIGGIFKVLSTETNMAWIIAVALVAILCLVFVLLKVAMPKFKMMQKLVDKLNLVSREILTGLPVIRAFSREKHEEQRFDKANRNLTGTMLFTNRVMTFMMPAMMLIMNLITVLIIWVGAGQINNGTLQVGDMMAFITYTMQIVMSFLMLTMVSVMLPRAAVSAERIDEVINAISSVADKPVTEKADKHSIKGDVTFDSVSFHYPDATENVISNISFTAKSGQTTAIIGSTGSGKSTLVHLIPRFYDVTEGKITIDGIDVRDISQHDLRELIGFVPQKGVLFSGTIESNIKYSGSNITDDDMKTAAIISQSEEFISAKPDGYQTPVSQGGSNVSGGQKQRLSIARAIAKNPKIFVFDDSFSALDFKTDAALRKALGDNIKDSTVIIVAQRISTILHAEQIIVLDEGKIAGIGTHRELMEGCEVYRQIAVSQLSQKDLELTLQGGKEGENE